MNRKEHSATPWRKIANASVPAPELPIPPSPVMPPPPAGPGVVPPDIQEPSYDEPPVPVHEPADMPTPMAMRSRGPLRVGTGLHRRWH